MEPRVLWDTGWISDHVQSGLDRLESVVELMSNPDRGIDDLVIVWSLGLVELEPGKMKDKINLDDED